MNSPESSSVSRRHFSKGALGLAGSALTGLPFSSSAAAAADHTPASLLTPAEEFYTVARGNPKPHTLTGQALVDARLTADSWRLEITADPFVDPPGIKLPAVVEKPRSLPAGNALDLHSLEKLGTEKGVKYLKAMQCLNIAEPLGQGLWEGVPLGDVLRLCGTLENVRRIYFRGFHNNDPDQVFQSSVSYTQAFETPPGELPVILAYRLNGEPIPLVRGGPVRMIVPWAHGFKSIKWLQQIFLTNDYQTNDTYALRNNDPESYLKTSAYVDDGPESVSKGEPANIVGRVISGLSGFERLEIHLRSLDNGEEKRLTDVELDEVDWRPADILPAPDWDTALPAGISPRELEGFDSKTGAPLSWPTRYGMASWSYPLSELGPGRYELYARTVDANGIAQPEPRPMRKAGKNMIQSHRFEVH